VPLPALLLGRRGRDDALKRNANGIEQQHEVVESRDEVAIEDAGKPLPRPPGALPKVGTCDHPAHEMHMHPFGDRGLDMRSTAAGAFYAVFWGFWPREAAAILPEVVRVGCVVARRILSGSHMVILAHCVRLKCTLDPLVRLGRTISRVPSDAAHRRDVPEINALSAYRPMLADQSWQRVQAFVLDVIAIRCADMSKRQVEEHRRTLAYFADWALQTGMVDPEEALRPDVIDIYREDRAHEIVATMAERERKMLLRLAAIKPGRERRAVSTSSAPERPYTEAELATLYMWATHQRTDYQRISCLAIFVFGVGCGLTASESMAVTRSDIIPVEGTLAVRVARDGRIVPVVDRWRHCLERVAEMAGEGLVIAPNAKDRTAAIRSVLECSIGEMKPTPTRLRRTWEVAHIEAGTPLSALLPAAGMTSTDSLRRPMEFVRPCPPERAIAALRMQVNA